MINFDKFNNLMRYLISLLLLFIVLSCSNKENYEFSGDWKLITLYETVYGEEDNKPFPEPAPTISFRSDNLVFYYNTLMSYEIKGDSMILYDDRTKTVSRKFKYKFYNQDEFSFSFIRKLKVDSIGILDINYKSIWSKVK